MSTTAKGIALLLVLAMIVGSLIIWQRSRDLTFMGNRVASTARKLVGGDRVQLLRLSRSGVRCSVLTPAGVEVRQSSPQKVHTLPVDDLQGMYHFSLAAIDLDAGADLLKQDSSIVELTITATDDPARPNVRAVHRGGREDVLTPGFAPA